MNLMPSWLGMFARLAAATWAARAIVERIESIFQLRGIGRDSSLNRLGLNPAWGCLKSHDLDRT